MKNGESSRTVNGYKTKVDIIYEILMKKISGGEYQDGDRVVISQISKENGVSDIPVREAIRRLESEGYITVTPNQGAVVRCFSKERLSEIFQIKAVLEGYAARLSVDYITPADIEELKLRNNELRLALKRNDMKAYSRLNVEFHLRIYRDLPQRELYGMIQDLWKKYSITKTVFSVAPTRMEKSIDEHEEILRLIEEKDYDQVERLMRAHKMQAGFALIQEIRQREEAAQKEPAAE